MLQCLLLWTLDFDALLPLWTLGLDALLLPLWTLEHGLPEAVLAHGSLPVKYLGELVRERLRSPR